MDFSSLMTKTKVTKKKEPPPVIIEEPKYFDIETRIVDVDCDLSSETVVSTKSSIDDFLTSTFEQIQTYLEDIVKLNPKHKNSGYLGFLHEIRKKIVDHTTAVLDERLSSDRKSLIAYKKKILEHLTITRETSNKFRESYDAAARYRENTVLDALRAEFEERYARDTAGLQTQLEQQDYAATILMNKIESQAHEIEVLKSQTKKQLDDIRLLEVKLSIYVKRPKPKGGKKKKQSLLEGRVGGGSDSENESTTCKSCQQLRQDVANLKETINELSHAVSMTMSMPMTDITGPNSPHGLMAKSASVAFRPSTAEAAFVPAAFATAGLGPLMVETDNAIDFYTGGVEESKDSMQKGQTTPDRGGLKTPSQGKRAKGGGESAPGSPNPNADKKDKNGKKDGKKDGKKEKDGKDSKNPKVEIVEESSDLVPPREATVVILGVNQDDTTDASTILYDVDMAVDPMRGPVPVYEKSNFAVFENEIESSEPKEVEILDFKEEEGDKDAMSAAMEFVVELQISAPAQVGPLTLSNGKDINASPAYVMVSPDTVAYAVTDSTARGPERDGGGGGGDVAVGVAAVGEGAAYGGGSTAAIVGDSAGPAVENETQTFGSRSSPREMAVRLTHNAAPSAVSSTAASAASVSIPTHSPTPAPTWVTSPAPAPAPFTAPAPAPAPATAAPTVTPSADAPSLVLVGSVGVPAMKAASTTVASTSTPVVSSDSAANVQVATISEQTLKPAEVDKDKLEQQQRSAEPLAVAQSSLRAQQGSGTVVAAIATTASTGSKERPQENGTGSTQSRIALKNIAIVKSSRSSTEGNESPSNSNWKSTPAAEFAPNTDIAMAAESKATTVKRSDISVSASSDKSPLRPDMTSIQPSTLVTQGRQTLATKGPMGSGSIEAEESLGAGGLDGPLSGVDFEDTITLEMHADGSRPVLVKRDSSRQLGGHGVDSAVGGSHLAVRDSGSSDNNRRSEEKGVGISPPVGMGSTPADIAEQQGGRVDLMEMHMGVLNEVSVGDREEFSSYLLPPEPSTQSDGVAHVSFSAFSLGHFLPDANEDLELNSVDSKNMTGESGLFLKMSQRGSGLLVLRDASSTAEELELMDPEQMKETILKATEANNELQTRLLSLEYQNAKLSKKIRLEEAQMERQESLYKLQLKERGLLLQLLVEQVTDLRAKLTRQEVVEFTTGLVEIPVRNLKRTTELSRKDYPLPHIKLDNSGAFENRQLLNVDTKELKLSASQPNLLSTQREGSASRQPPSPTRPMGAEGRAAAVSRSLEGLVYSELVSPTAHDIPRPSTTSGVMQGGVGAAGAGVNIASVLRSKVNGAQQLDHHLMANLAGARKKRGEEGKFIPIGGVKPKSAGASTNAISGLQQDYTVVVDGFNVAATVPPDRLTELRALREQIGTLLVAQSLRKPVSNTMMATTKARDTKLIGKEMRLKPLNNMS